MCMLEHLVASRTRREWLAESRIGPSQRPHDDPRNHAGLAQLVEHAICNHEAVGSNPTPGSITSPEGRL